MFNCKSQLKIVNNVALVKLKRNFSQTINAFTNWVMFLYGQLQSPRPSQCPPFGRALRRALGFVAALFGSTKSELMAKEVAEFSIILFGKMGCWAFFCPRRLPWLPQYKCMEIFRTLNNRYFCIYWYIDLKLAEIFQNGLLYILLKFC